MSNKVGIMGAPMGIPLHCLEPMIEQMRKKCQELASLVAQADAMDASLRADLESYKKAQIEEYYHILQEKGLGHCMSGSGCEPFFVPVDQLVLCYIIQEWREEYGKNLKTLCPAHFENMLASTDRAEQNSEANPPPDFVYRARKNANGRYDYEMRANEWMPLPDDVCIDVRPSTMFSQFVTRLGGPPRITGSDDGKSYSFISKLHTIG